MEKPDLQTTELLKEYSNEMKAELDSILSYWAKNTCDNVNGGFIGCIDENNNSYPDAPKGSVLNSRILWAFSSAYTVTKKEEYLHLARVAYNYIVASFIDKDYGGIYWSLTAKGEPLDAKKQMYALAFAIDLPEMFPIFQDAAPFTYYDFRASDGHVVCTGGPYAKAGQQDVDKDHLKEMAKRVQAWLPELAGKEPKYTWAVDLKVAPKMVPHLEKLGQVAPGSSIEGLGALGVLPGILLGRKAALNLVSTLRIDK